MLKTRVDLTDFEKCIGSIDVIEPEWYSDVVQLTEATGCDKLQPPPHLILDGPR